MAFRAKRKSTDDINSTTSVHKKAFLVLEKDVFWDDTVTSFKEDELN